MTNNPLTNIFCRLRKNRSTSRVIPSLIEDQQQAEQHYNRDVQKYERSTSRIKPVLEVEEQVIKDRFGDEPM
jgi:hypothetical protein